MLLLLNHEYRLLTVLSNRTRGMQQQMEEWSALAVLNFAGKIYVVVYIEE